MTSFLPLRRPEWKLPSEKAVQSAAIRRSAFWKYGANGEMRWSWMGHWLSSDRTAAG
jgi:hypothetical protein